MAQHKRDKRDNKTTPLRLPSGIVKRFKEYAERETRSVPGQITVALKEWLAMKEAATPQQTATQDVPSTIHSPIPKVMRKPQGSSPRGANPSPIPADVQSKVMEDDSEGWEGTDPKVLGGTKVKI